MLISKIISGGQTGVDRGAIEAALELGFPYGGLFPKGRLVEDGAVPERFDRMEIAPKRTVCLLFGEPRAEMRSDAGRAETVVQNRLDDDVVALDVVIDGEREVRNHHAVMSEVDRVYACETGEGIECGGDVLHEVVKYPCAVGGIEVLSLDEVEFGKGRESHVFHVTVRSFGPSDGTLHRPSHRRGSCLRRTAVRGGRVPAHAIPAACMHLSWTQATTKGSPSPEPSARCPSRRFPAAVPTFSISPFANIIAKPAEWRKGVRER